jgi:hypothetical protein
MGFNFFGWGSSDVDSDELPLIFPLEFKKEQFIEIDVMHIYSKILTDVMERCHGLDDEQQELLWDNCIASEANHGLISLLSRAMTFRRNLFLVYDKALSVLRLANPLEQAQIEADYKKQGSSAAGVFISFQHFLRSDLVRLYSALEYATIAGLHKSMNLSIAMQLKISDLRSSTSLIDSADVKAQAQKIAKSLAHGRDIMIDAKDEVENTLTDLTAVKASIDYLSEKRAFYLGMPASYLTGIQTGGLGSTGEQDTKAVERGLKNYYYSILKPVLEVLFDADLSYKSQDFRQIDQAMNALKTFALVDEEIISLENKTLIINKLLDLDEDEEGDGPEPKETLPPEDVDLNNSYPVI